MTAATTCVWLGREDARKAIDLWCELVPGARLVREQTFPNPAGEDYSADVYTVEIAGRPVQVMGAGNTPEHSMAMSIWLEVDDQAALDRVWDGFVAAGGKALACGWVVDPYGVHWQVLPATFPELTDPSDPARAQRVIEQVWRMGKLTFEALDEAARG